MTLTDKLKYYTKKAANALLIAGMSMGLSSCLVINALGHDNSEALTGRIEKPVKVEQKDSINVIGYNIAHCRGAFPPAENDFLKNLTIHSKEQVYDCLDKLAEMLIKEKADIVCLNEVDWKATWSYNINYVKYLAEKAGYNHYSFGTKWDQLWPFFWVKETDAIFPFLKVHIGNAILSKHPVVKAKNKSFDGEDAIDWLIGEHTYLDALIDVNGKELRTICTHLDSDSVENRTIEVKKLVQEARYSDVPIIIGTDFNSVLSKAKKRSKVLQREYQGDKAMDIIVNSGLFNVYMENVNPADIRYYTSNSGEEYKTIDFIITTKDLEIEEYRVLHYIYSDHKAVFAKIKWK